ncbi:hypothetical protein [Sphingorhabdus lacus]|jgi:hypothetical protein|uniref:Uncharacterized protein n=1 Tax=Sphingorhabdus lacus TaxID=392610 RepID=A0A6I6L990_9SPHN|nr:hypothetical protein [Sphingorhabdus lacus]QGY80596.1 hypothetical protein EUU25_08165 [Sphingorhabdus lacus]
MARAEHATIRLQRSYSKRMSDHVAFALVVYTLALIFLVTPRMESDGTSIFPYFLLVLLVALVIAPCRNLERRWQALQATDNGDGSLDRRFNADRAMLWIAAVALPAVFALICHIIAGVA